MKLYRKDRLFANDKEKTEGLIDSLKNVRITDESTYFNSHKTNDRQGSPPHSPNVGHRNNIPRSGAGGAGGASGGGGGGSTVGGGFNSGVKGTSFTPSGEAKNRGQSGHASSNNATSDYASNAKTAHHSAKQAASESNVAGNGGAMSSISSMH